ncbi:MAG: DUF721 domain-containing protein [Endomicrobium sp.]|jgi:hypothetical protein|uniref:DciA family protein n=1 Tax=Candidatus Endomicrobiellum cubanum TaxID=3242325 RepID=UPI002838C588|nr:DUF721 domain-containing protein [Endomicrobium sp.]MDR2395747.1 DUF721 domain-containing protein [Endomicrobium sp.]
MAWTQAYDIISALKKKFGLENEFFTITKVWAKETGIDGIDVIGYKDGTIFAKTQSSVAVYEFNLRKKEIIRKLNQYVGKSTIKDIKVKIV